ncbi:hypothetical protein [Alkalispirochaeta alkalica]|nr:hypothetical protein [Alkalispirochaeta alkalica]
MAKEKNTNNSGNQSKKPTEPKKLPIKYIKDSKEEKKDGKKKLNG